MSLTGKGFFIWKIKDCEQGNPDAIVNAAQAAGMSHVLIKIADGAFPYNIVRETKKDLIEPVASALKAAGISVWGWHYVYGEYPINEANIAVSQMKKFNLDGYVIDAEWEYKEPGKKNAASAYMKILRKNLGDIPIALSSYRFPAYHPQLPWKTFLEYCDLNMPQVYWEKAHNPEAQLVRTVKEFHALNPSRPVIPTGPTYRAGAWVPNEKEINEFLHAAKKLNLSAANFFSWDECRPALNGLWNEISQFDWQNPGPEEKDITERWVDGMNSGKPELVMETYTKNAVHITSDRTIQGLVGLRNWYEVLLTKQYSGCSFLLTSHTGKGSSRHMEWLAKKNGNVVLAGSDTLGLLNQKIAYHFTQLDRSV